MSVINTKILNLFKAYTAKELNDEQFELLKKWINQSPENKEQFSKYLLFYKRSRVIAFSDAIDENKAWDKVVSKLKQPLIKSVKKEFKARRLLYKYAVAAGIVIALASAYVLKDRILDDSPVTVTPTIVNNQIEPGSDKAILTLENGEEVYLEKGKAFKQQNAMSNGEEIEYTAINSNSKEVIFNYLTVPRGGQFYIRLSDGTRVWLNSETQIKYPVNFIDGKTRQVVLVYGEAYFEVSPSDEHNGSRFKVYNNHQEVEVLGTEFNIKAYLDEDNVYTTLVEGSVAVSVLDKNGYTLLPQQQSTLNLTDSTLKIKEVDIRSETAWVNGEFVLQHKSLKEIMTVLSRWYDMDVIFENKDLEGVRFVGILRKNQNIIEILDTIKSLNVIKDYEINNKQVILK